MKLDPGLNTFDDRDGARRNIAEATIVSGPPEKISDNHKEIDKNTPHNTLLRRRKAKKGVTKKKRRAQ